MLSCGLIMFDEDNRVLIVKTRKGVFSFPKGKKEDYDSSNYECARREFLEEAGIYGFIYKTDKEEIKSKSKKEHKKIIYYTCKIVKRMNSFETFLSDPDDAIIESFFLPIQEALNLENFEQERKNILLIAYQKVKNNDLYLYDSFLSLKKEMKSLKIRT